MEVEDILTELDIILDWFELAGNSGSIGQELARMRLEHLIKTLEEDV